MLGLSYPKLSADGIDEINITGNLILGLIWSVLNHTKGTKDDNLIKRIYSIVDGWIVKVITGFPSEVGSIDLTTYWSRFMFDSDSFEHLLSTFVLYLDNFMNKGFYQGSIAASQETISLVKLAERFTQLLLNAKCKVNNQNIAFDKYIITWNGNKDSTHQSLLWIMGWLFLNFT